MYQSILRSRKHARKHGGDADLPFAEGDDQTYAFVRTLLGNGRITVLCNDGTDHLGRIAGSMRRTRRAVIEKGDVVLCCRRSFDAVVDVVHKYRGDDVRVLVRNAVLSDAILKELGLGKAGEDDGVHFEASTVDDDLAAI